MCENLINKEVYVVDRSDNRTKIWKSILRKDSKGLFINNVVDVNCYLEDDNLGIFESFEEASNRIIEMLQADVKDINKSIAYYKNMKETDVISSF